MASIKVSVLVENEVRASASRLHANLTTTLSSPTRSHSRRFRPSVSALHCCATTDAVGTHAAVQHRSSGRRVEEKVVNFLKYIALKFCTDEKARL